MKKYSSFINNERGFYLPVVLIVSVVMISATTTTIFIYKNEIKATELLLEQLEIETSLQIAMEKFNYDKEYETSDSGKFNYTLPHGIVTGSFTNEVEYTFVELRIATDHLEYKHNYFIYN